MPRRTSRSSRERANRREGSKQKGYKKGAGGGGREGASPVLERKHAVRPRKPAILNLDQKVLDPSIKKQFQRPKKSLHVRGLVEKID